MRQAARQTFALVAAWIGGIIAGVRALHLAATGRYHPTVVAAAVALACTYLTYRWAKALLWRRFGPSMSVAALLGGQPLRSEEPHIVNRLLNTRAHHARRRYRRRVGAAVVLWMALSVSIAMTGAR